MNQTSRSHHNPDTKMQRSGHADLPLHGGRVPKWLSRRMEQLGGAISEAVIMEYGRQVFLTKMSDPMWFQSLGAVMGMDWHSSGITTSVMGALKRSLNKRSHELGVFVCGGRGRYSRRTPDELNRLAEKTGLDGEELIRSSKLSAKVDNTAIQDGFQLYLHNFIVSLEGDWVVIQQGMNTDERQARRYHWHSSRVRSFVETPHTAVCGENLGKLLNLTAEEAATTRDGILDVSNIPADKMVKEVRSIRLPGHHDVRPSDINLRRLAAVVTLARESDTRDFESLLLTPGMGPRTLQSLTLVSEIIHGTPSRFDDPARFSFAHGGKDGHPFPVPLKVYDETINILNNAISHARLGLTEKREAMKGLSSLAKRLESQFTPSEDAFSKIVARERRESETYGGRIARRKRKQVGQLSLWD